jgi:hypothetical protein
LLCPLEKGFEGVKQTDGFPEPVPIIVRHRRLSWERESLGFLGCVSGWNIADTGCLAFARASVLAARIAGVN